MNARPIATFVTARRVLPDESLGRAEVVTETAELVL